ncbi:TOBE-like domain-containing protein [Lysinibacillus sp. BNK-21]|uniref:TOBE-like domain-containing protein n=1 Tax=Lysinibacillus sp. BNK-21 TaxID=3376156 RepID=UPI003B42FCBD
MQIEKTTVPGTVPVKINHIHLLGPIVQIELHCEDIGEFLEAELSKEQFLSLELKIGDQVFVKPKQQSLYP